MSEEKQLSEKQKQEAVRLEKKRLRDLRYQENLEKAKAIRQKRKEEAAIANEKAEIRRKVWADEQAKKK